MTLSAADPAPALDYPISEPPGPGQTRAVAAGIDWVRMPLPFRLDHINLWRLDGSAGWTVVDCGLGSRTTRALWQGLLADRPLERVLVTHFHPDHIGNAGWFAETFLAPVHMTQGEFLMAHFAATAGGPGGAEQQTFWRRHGLDEARVADSAGGGSYADGVPTLPASYHRLRDGDAVTVGGGSWRVIVATGHAPEQATLYDAARGVLIAGDQVLPRISPNITVWPTEPDADPLADFLASLDRLSALPAETLVLPSHGLPFYGLHQRIAELKRHHRDRLDEILAAADRPITAADLLPVLFRSALEGFQLRFGMGESIAHLNHLAAQGALLRLAEPGRPIRFVRPDRG